MFQKSRTKLFNKGIYVKSQEIKKRNLDKEKVKQLLEIKVNKEMLIKPLSCISNPEI